MKRSLESKRAKVIAIITAVAVIAVLAVVSVIFGKKTGGENGTHSEPSGPTTELPSEEPPATEIPDAPPVEDPLELKEITDVTAERVQVDYDGQGHTVKIVNTLSEDKVYYAESPNGPWREEEIRYAEEGEYRVYYKIVRAGYAEYIGYGDISIKRKVLTDITVESKKFVYDGEAHNIEIKGITSRDKLTYSTDGETFAEEISITGPGRYEVYIRVDRENGGYYRGSATLVIVPNLYGRYINIDGIMEIDERTEYDETGKGEIDGKAFEATDEGLSCDGKIYKRIGEEERVYRITVNDRDYFICEEETLEVEANAGTGKIVINGKTLETETEFNYIEKIEANGREIIGNTFEVEGSADVTGIRMTLSKREIYTPSATEYTVYYDGKEHEVECEYDGEVRYVIEGQATTEPPKVKEIGEYEYEITIENEKYLPAATTVKVTVKPEGVYYTESGILDFSDCTELKLDGKDIRSEDGEVLYDGKRYRKQDKPLLVVTVMGKTTVTEPTVEIKKIWLTVEITDAGVTLSDDEGNMIATVAAEIADANSVTVTANGKPGAKIGNRVMFTPSELSTPASYVVIEVR